MIVVEGKELSPEQEEYLRLLFLQDHLIDDEKYVLGEYFAYHMSRGLRSGPGISEAAHYLSDELMKIMSPGQLNEKIISYFKRFEE